MIAVDTNILVYAHREEAQFHAAAAERVAGLAEGRATWAIPWACMHEFYGVVTNPRVFNPPTKPAVAMATIDGWLEAPRLQMLHESADHWSILARLLRESKAVGGRVHDARIAAVCLGNGVREIWSADRDFRRFGGLAVRNPLLG